MHNILSLPAHVFSPVRRPPHKIFVVRPDYYKNLILFALQLFRFMIYWKRYPIYWFLQHIIRYAVFLQYTCRKDVIL